MKSLKVHPIQLPKGVAQWGLFIIIVEMLLRSLRQYFCGSLIRQGGEESGIFRTKRKVVQDRFDLHTLTSIEYMCHLIRTDKYKLTHDQNIALFYRLTQVFQILGKSKYYFEEFGILTERITAKFKNPDDVERLGTFVRALCNMDMYNQTHWAFICDFIDQKKYDDSYDQVYGLITGFKHMKEKFPNSWISFKTVQIYRQLFDVTLLHLRQKRYNLKEVRQLAHCFHKYGVNEDYVWEDVQFFLKTKLVELEQKPFTNQVVIYQQDTEKSMFQNTVTTVPILQELTEIAYILAFNRLATLQFIQFCQKLVGFYLKNKRALKEEFIRAQQVRSLSEKQKQSSELGEHQQPYRLIYMDPINITDQYIIFFLFILKRTMDKFMEYTVDRALFEWARDLVFEQYNRYTVGEIILINKIAQFLQVTQEKMLQFTLNKIKIVRDKAVKIDDLKLLFEIVGNSNLQHVQELVIHFLKTAHPSQVYDFSRFCQRYMAYIPRYFVDLPYVVNQHYKYYSFDQNCYFYYTLLTNEVYWQSLPRGGYEGQMQILKETIKTSAFSRGFKIRMDSYFHKLLQHIDLAEFFDGGS